MAEERFGQKSAVETRGHELSDKKIRMVLKKLNMNERYKCIHLYYIIYTDEKRSST